MDELVTEQEDGFNTLSLKRQEDFYSNEYDASYKQVVIVSDALRYEVAAELMEELAKEKQLLRSQPIGQCCLPKPSIANPPCYRTVRWNGREMICW